MTTWEQVHTWIQVNPHKSASLSHYKHASQSIEGSNEVPDIEGWIKHRVDPPTPLSAILLFQDTMYSASPETARKAMLRDETTDLQEKATIHLKGRAWPIRRTAEGLSAVGLEEGRPSVWTELGWRALAILRECQFVVINESSKTIQFFPEDIRTWIPTTDILFLDHEARSIWTSSSPVHLLSWLSKQESQNWSINWPLADGTMEELRSSAATLQLNTAGKLKETLRKLVGHGQAIHLLSKWNH
jgi:hypothetical protein